MIGFYYTSLGGTARVELFDGGQMDISQHESGAVTIGSLEGNGTVLLGANNLTAGANNLSTTFTGNILDGRNGSGGSFTKAGASTLILASANGYTGGTTVIGRGTLLINNKKDSGTGTGLVQVNSGALGGAGTIAGAVKIGDGTGAPATLIPGESKRNTGALTVLAAVTFESDAQYEWKVDAIRDKASRVTAAGASIGSDALFVGSDTASGTLAAGTTFTVIDNTAATPIAGAFANLPDGGTITIGNNTFQASYSGGDGNDLTLTVVP
jgi:autotransporter-associated beta strand protein